MGKNSWGGIRGTWHLQLGQGGCKRRASLQHQVEESRQDGTQLIRFSAAKRSLRSFREDPSIGREPSRTQKQRGLHGGQVWVSRRWLWGREVTRLVALWKWRTGSPGYPLDCLLPSWMDTRVAPGMAKSQEVYTQIPGSRLLDNLEVKTDGEVSM